MADVQRRNFLPRDEAVIQHSIENPGAADDVSLQLRPRLQAPVKENLISPNRITKRSECRQKSRLKGSAFFLSALRIAGFGHPSLEICRSGSREYR